MSSAAALGVTRTGCCAGVNWILVGFDSKLQIKPIHLGQGCTLTLISFALFKNPKTGALHSPDLLQYSPLFI